MILPPSARSCNAPSAPVASAGGLLKFSARLLGRHLAEVEDDRCVGRLTVPTGAVLRAVVMGFMLNLGSIRATEDRLRMSAGFRALAGVPARFSDDTMRDVLTRASHTGLYAVLYGTAQRDLLRWGCGRYLESQLARRLKPLGCSRLAAKAVVAIDGHETFCSEKVRCADCHTRTKTVKRGGKVVEVTEYYHKLVVAHRIGAHPAVVLDAEPIRAGEGEVTAAYRLVARLSDIYGDDIGVIVADALYDSEVFRTRARHAGYRTVIRHKREDRQPGADLAARVQRRDPKRENPDGRHKDPVNGCRYEYWCEQEPHQGRRYVEVRRTDPKGKVQVGALVTDLPSSNVPAMASAILMEMRWWIENTAFHELAGQLSFDRAYLHKNRATGAWAVVLLALVAYNAWQMYVYRNLDIDPQKPRRTWGDLRRDLLESLHQLKRRTAALAWARPP